MWSLRPGVQWSRQIGRSAKATGNAPQLSSRSSEPVSELQDLLYLVGGGQELARCCSNEMC